MWNWHQYSFMASLALAAAVTIVEACGWPAASALSSPVVWEAAKEDSTHSEADGCLTMAAAESLPGLLPTLLPVSDKPDFPGTEKKGTSKLQLQI